MKETTESNAPGEIGKIYQTPHGNETFDFAMDEGNCETGWEQVGPNKRRKVIRSRISHSVLVWRAVEDESGADHRQYPLF